MNDCKMVLTENASDRFWRHVEKTETCWIWTASKWKGTRGYAYGKFYADGKRVMRFAHRVSYHLLVGCCCAEQCLRHTCDNGLCVNPAHLIPGTHGENMADSLERNRRPVGTRAYNSKITLEQLREIRTSPESGAALGRKFGMSTAAICYIRRGERYKYE